MNNKTPEATYEYDEFGRTIKIIDPYFYNSYFEYDEKFGVMVYAHTMGRVGLDVRGQLRPITMDEITKAFNIEKAERIKLIDMHKDRTIMKNLIKKDDFYDRPPVILSNSQLRDKFGCYHSAQIIILDGDINQMDFMYPWVEFLVYPPQKIEKN
jgi:hypothetical protein